MTIFHAGFRIKLNQRQREHLTRGLQATAIGQLAYFGYRMITQGKIWLFVVSLFLYAAIESYALFLLRDIR